ncbi:sphingomyelin phosphodiesterase 4-like isoform X2 [Antedon mediterranea]|uniref:sphingomyelin phosphodiesterase 4-like isoform X2 n=1 Tax=Antedon mediterranea TaxID=105859 RepID=UPI003AF7182D
MSSQQNRDRFSPILERVSKLPSLGVRRRCEELQQLFVHYNYKELKPIFPRLLQDIFSHNKPTGWGLNLMEDTRQNPWHDVRLRTTKESMQSDFKIVRDFLSPTGSLFDLIYKFQADPTVKFEFPVDLLPAPTRDAFKQGSAVPQFYHNKLSYMAPNCLQLSAFDFYMFHFAHFLVSLPSVQPVQNACTIENSLYTNLVEDYLNCFLPISGNRVPLMPYTGTSPSGYNQGGNACQTRQSGGQQPQVSLLRNINSLQRSTSMGHGDSHLESIGQENWRSEILIQVLVEFWLNQNSLYYDQKSFSQQVRANVLPSQDLVRLVRMLVKHLHFFANSAKEIHPSLYHQVDEPLEDLKRCIIPMVQNKLYAFFRHGFDRWPLDSSFRLMLETWLSFIQPWRYMDPQNINDDKDQPMSTASKKFVGENLHFYTILFQEYIQRALRHDLAALKNAQMLFRVGKVFGQGDLHEVIDDAEHSVTNYHGVTTNRVSNAQLTASGSFISLSPTSSSTSVLQRVAEVEGPSFRYRSMFGFQCKQMMEQLLKNISQVKSTLNNPQNAGQKPKMGIFDWLSSLGIDDADSANRAKASGYLEYSMSYFGKIFQMETISHNTSMTWGTPTKSGEQTAPDMSGGELTPLGRYQIVNGLRRFNVTYNGNPDLQPIRTYENKCLVRFLHKLSTWLNTVWGNEIQDLCLTDGFISTFAYQYFQPPYQQSPSHDDTLLPDNKPRICLRFLASYRSIIYLLVFFMVLYWLDFSLLGVVFVLLLTILMYGVVGASCTLLLSKEHISHMD